MKKRILLIAGLAFILMLLANISATPFYYQVSMDYDKGNVNIKSVDIKFSNDEIKNILNPHYFKTYKAEVSDGNSVLKEIEFSLTNRIIYDTANSSGQINGSYIEDRDNLSFEIFVPYYQNARDIIIYDENNNELAKADVSYYSKGQTPEKIGGDKDSHGCLISAGYSWCEEKQKCLRAWEEECFSSTITKNSQENIIDTIGSYWWILVIILVILIIILIYPRKDKKKK
ncbi:Uncharacterised protein [uncultured archaeon]|nr:Uncharacterised protein [uncultured archaeon]